MLVNTLLSAASYIFTVCTYLQIQIKKPVATHQVLHAQLKNWLLLLTDK